MRYNLKRELEKKGRFAPGHRLCAGCGAAVAVNGVLRALEPEDKAVIIGATNATRTLQDGMLISMDCSRGVVQAMAK